MGVVLSLRDIVRRQESGKSNPKNKENLRMLKEEYKSYKENDDK